MVGQPLLCMASNKTEEQVAGASDSVDWNQGITN